MESLRKKSKICIAVLLMVSLLAGCASSGSYSPDEPLNPEENGRITGIADLTPANDFYGYVNAEELMNTELKNGERSAGTMDELTRNIDRQLEDLIHEVVNAKQEYPKGSDEYIIDSVYHQVYDFTEGDDQMDRLDEQFISGNIDEVNAVGSMDELFALWEKFSKNYAIDSLFTAQIETDVYDTTRNVAIVKSVLPVSLDTLTDNDAEAASARDTLKETLILTGIGNDEAKERATDIIYMMLEIAGHTNSSDDSEEEEEDESASDPVLDFVYYSKEDISKKISNISYDRFCNLLGFRGQTPDRLSVPDMEQISFITSILDDAHLNQWKDLTLIAVMTDREGVFPKKYSRSSSSSRGSDSVAVSRTKKYCEDEIARLYVDKYYDEEKVQIATEICNQLKDQYYEMIGSADWMSEEGKAYCKAKLDKMEFYIGAELEESTEKYPQDVIGPTIYRTILNMKVASKKKNLKTLNEKADHNGFHIMAPTADNACYVADFNCINVTLAFMGDQTLDTSKPYEWNLGRIGTVIGHEISHAFDSNGLRYNADGNFTPEAMPEADREAFKEIQKKVAEYYSDFTVLGSHVNGNLTITENLADMSGVQAILEIAGTPEKQKTVMEAYAGLWCSLLCDEDAKELLDYDVHSPDSIRVNAVLPLFDCYYEVYDVKEGDPMFIAPEDRVRRW